MDCCGKKGTIKVALKLCEISGARLGYSTVILSEKET